MPPVYERIELGNFVDEFVVVIGPVSTADARYCSDLIDRGLFVEGTEAEKLGDAILGGRKRLGDEASLRSCRHTQFGPDQYILEHNPDFCLTMTLNADGRSPVNDRFQSLRRDNLEFVSESFLPCIAVVDRHNVRHSGGIMRPDNPG
jgi:hypothetical protein